MIVASLLLILGAIVLLVLGLTNGSSGLLVGSIGVSLLAAVALVVGARQATAARAAAGVLDEDDEQFEGDEDDERHERERRTTSRMSVRAPARAGSWEDDLLPVDGVVTEGGFGPDPMDETVLLDSGYPGLNTGSNVPAQAVGGRDDDYDDEDPPDEPVAQRVSPADAARIARMAIEVLVIDGRPRYHVAGCVHLLGRPVELLPVAEAVDLGFSPCGLCEPDSALLADARRV